MNNLFFSFFIVFVWFMRGKIYPLIRQGRVKEGFCGLWFLNSIFSLSGTVLSHYLHHYSFSPLFILRNLFFLLIYVAAGIVIVLLAPTGYKLFIKKSTPSEEEMLLYEYRFHETADLICRIFQFLLFVVPIIIFILTEFQTHLPATLCRILDFFVKNKLYGGLCFWSFFILLPLSLRQTLYWLKSLKTPTTAAELAQQRIYSARLRYRKRNRLL